MKFTILVDPFLVIIATYSVCPIYAQEIEILREIMHFHFMTLWHHALAQGHRPGGHEIYNFGWPFHGHHDYTCIQFVWSMLRSREEYF